MRALAWIGLAVIGLLLIDRAMLAAERRGWVYWRHRKPTSGARSAAAGMLGELNMLATPSYRHVVEQLKQDELRVDVQGRGEGEPPNCAR